MRGCYLPRLQRFSCTVFFVVAVAVMSCQYVPGTDFGLAFVREFEGLSFLPLREKVTAHTPYALWPACPSKRRSRVGSGQGAAVCNQRFT